MNIINDISISKGIIMESEEFSSDVLKFKIVLLEADKPGLNGRIYPRDVVKKAIEDIKPKLQMRALVGELDHPVGTELRKKSIWAKNSSHLITSLEIDNQGKVWGVVETLNTEMGRTLKSIIEQNIAVGMSIRALAEFVREGNYLKAVDMYILTWDAVINPSFTATMFTKEHAIESLLNQ